ncbi:MAG: IPExxxVDY family protein, partial [Rhizobacter sp.]|nr:IPExxxVDY family protein [Rhizobacter sp.]
MSRTLRHKLDLTPDPEVNVIGISCHENDYRLCWSLNRGLGIALARRDHDIVDEDAGDSATFPAFDHEDAERQVRYTLVCNRGGAGALVREQRMADYFLVVDEQAPES